MEPGQRSPLREPACALCVGGALPGMTVGAFLPHVPGEPCGQNDGGSARDAAATALVPLPVAGPWEMPRGAGQVHRGEGSPLRGRGDAAGPKPLWSMGAPCLGPGSQLGPVWMEGDWTDTAPTAHSGQPCAHPQNLPVPSGWSPRAAPPRACLSLGPRGACPAVARPFPLRRGCCCLTCQGWRRAPPPTHHPHLFTQQA